MTPVKRISTCQIAAQATAAGVPRPCDRDRVTTAAYPGHATIPSFARVPFTTGSSSTTAPAVAWMNRLEVTKVDFHDRWPLHSTS